MASAVPTIEHILYIALVEPRLRAKAGGAVEDISNTD